MKRARVTLTAEGSLQLTADVAAEFFPHDALVALRRERELWLIPLTGPQGGGLFLKQRNARGDRATLIWESLPADPPVGELDAVWDDDRGGLRVDLEAR